MTTKNHSIDQQKGFSLLEMAIVLVIVGLLMAGLIPSITGQVEQQHRSETRKQLDDIQQALIGFAISNGRLPCPADGTIPTVAGLGNSAGQEKANCAAGANGGVLPWVTLGINETDAWGRRFTYRVTPDFADAINTTTYAGCTPIPAPTQSTFALCSSGNLSIGLTAGATNVANNIPAIIVSHGTDGLGAYMPSGQQVQPIPAANTDQGDNVDNDNNFVSHDFTTGFDDLVVWISPNILFNRMVMAGKLP
jgi:prepilin-type N-terminal cleavage/methylation domain-containing protein